MTGKRAWWGAGIPLAIEMAFEDINARNDILKEYRLQLVARDTQVRYRTCLFKHWIALYPPDKSLSSGYVVGKSISVINWVEINPLDSTI